MPYEAEPFSVNDYLVYLNGGIRELGGRIVGEICSLQLYSGRSYLYFSVKDKKSDALMRCFMWKRDYDLSGVQLEDGLEVIITGFPEIYKPNGGLSFQTKTVELVGEGALKKAYDKLKAQLEKEGIFSPAKKRPLPAFPQNIGIITSKDGAAIGDFLTNLGAFGFHVQMIDSRVEGQLATAELLGSIRTFRKKDIDVLVIVRGGGSLESFLAFNNEVLVREIATFPVPVLAGIGHERDICLLALAADLMVSTPTAAARALSEPWEKVALQVNLHEHKMLSAFSQALAHQHAQVDASFRLMQSRVQSIFDEFESAEQQLKQSFVALRSRLAELERDVAQYPKTVEPHMRTLLATAERRIAHALQSALSRTADAIQRADEKIDLRGTVRMLGREIERATHDVATLEKLIQTRDPATVLRLGYSIVEGGGGVVRDAAALKAGETVRVRLHSGAFESEITRITL